MLSYDSEKKNDPVKVTPMSFFFVSARNNEGGIFLREGRFLREKSPQVFTLSEKPTHAILHLGFKSSPEIPQLVKASFLQA